MFVVSQVDPSKRKEDSMVKEDKLSNHSTEADKDNTSDKTERICYETKIVGGVVVRTPVRKVCMLQLAISQGQIFAMPTGIIGWLCQSIVTKPLPNTFPTGYQDNQQVTDILLKVSQRKKNAKKQLILHRKY